MNKMLLSTLLYFLSVSMIVYAEVDVFDRDYTVPPAGYNDGRERREIVDPAYSKSSTGADIKDRTVLRSLLRFLDHEVNAGKREHALFYVKTRMNLKTDVETSDFLDYLRSVSARMYEEEKTLIERTLCNFNNPVSDDENAKQRWVAVDNLRDAIANKYVSLLKVELSKNSSERLMKWLAWKKLGMSSVTTDFSKIEGVPEGFFVNHVEQFCVAVAGGAVL